MQRSTFAPFVSAFRASLALLALMTLLTGLCYPALVTLLAQAAMPGRANGSLIKNGETVTGSALIGQSFTQSRYFWGRPSAATPPYNAAASAASNLSPGNTGQAELLLERVRKLQAAEPGQKARIPVDLITASASGLDPHISPEAAQWQASRIAKARRLPLKDVQALILAHTEGPQFGLFGQERVNVLRLNMALDGIR